MDEQKKKGRIKEILGYTIPFFLLSLLVDYLMKAAITTETLFKTIFVSLSTGILFSFLFTVSFRKKN